MSQQRQHGLEASFIELHIELRCVKKKRRTVLNSPSHFLCLVLISSTMAFVLAHDLGTSGNKASLFDEAGQLIASCTETYPVQYPRAGWAEQDPRDYWRAVCNATRHLLAFAGADNRDIACVSFSGQMMGVIAVEAHGEPLHNAIIWADQRAVDEARFIGECCGANEVYRITGHRISPAYTAAKMLWLKRHVPAVYAQSAHLLNVKDFVALKLTGCAGTDYSDASGSNLFDLQARCWRADFIEAIALDPGKLPAVYPSTHIIGEVTRQAAEETGLRAGTPVVIGGGDGACATIGAGVVDDGDAYCVLGTSSWISFTTSQPLFDAQQRTFTFHDLQPDRFLPMGTMQAAGGAREWLMRTMGTTSAVEEADVESIPAGCEGLLFLPYLMGERSPWWNPDARGAFIGLSMSHGPAHLHRAVLEGVAFNLKLILNVLAQKRSMTSLRLIGGGANSAAWRQILADVLGVPLEIPEMLSEATSWGAAVAGGVGAGVYPDWRIAKTQTRIRRTVEPQARLMPFYETRLAAFERAYLALQGAC